MKILYINDFAANFPGSFFESLLALSKALREKNNEIYYIFPRERDYIKRLTNWGSVYYCTTFMGKKFDLRLTKLVYGICREKKIDIIHTNFGAAGFLTASLLSGLLSFNHIAHQRSLSNNYFTEKVNLLKKYRVKIIFKLLKLIGNTYYIAISTGVKKSLINYNGISPQKIKVISNAVLADRTNIKYTDEKLINLIKLKKYGNFIVGMTAHFGPQKDHKTLVDAASLIVNNKPRTVFVLIGGNLVNDKSDFREQTEKYIKARHLIAHFIMIGEVQDPMPYIELFDVGCLISHWEGFGNALVEYMYKKKPVIGTAIGGIKDIIEDEINGYLIPHKRPDILAEKIVHLIENLSLAKQLGENGYRKAIREYNMSNWVDKVIDLYDNVLHG